MNHQKHYNKLMERAPKVKPKEGYFERHRILPGCMGGRYVAGNIAWLIPEEHYVAHQLLVKMYPKNYKLIHAVQCMTISNDRYDRSNNKLYGWIRRRLANQMRIDNPMFREEVRVKHKEKVNAAQTVDLRKSRSIRLKKSNPMKDALLRSRQSELMKLRMKDPIFKEKMMRNIYDK